MFFKPFDQDIRKYPCTIKRRLLECDRLQHYEQLVENEHIWLESIIGNRPLPGLELSEIIMAAPL